jgi:ATP-dependent RNA helicase RhlE
MQAPAKGDCKNMPFSTLGLAPEIERSVRDAGYETPTPIQEKAIPHLLEGRDLVGCAQTGTGKTAAFTLPILHRLRAGVRGRVRALILTPTRELAAQIAESVRTYGRHVNLKSATVYGGVGFQPQIDALRRGVDILIATPGRLLDHMGRGHADFRHLEVLVLDEADRMLDMGFIKDVRRIIKALPARRQTLLFSATMPDEIRRLAAEILRDPVNVEVAPRRSAPAQGVQHVVMQVPAARKRDLLAHLLRTEAQGQVLVFTRTKHGANKLARQLEGQGHAVTALHGNKSQSQRTRALSEFKSGTARVMVATDIAGRGLDVEGIGHVVNFDLPNVPEDYVHRVGRTARAGATGHAISLMSPEERPHMRAIEALIGKAIERRVVEGFPATAELADSQRHEPHGRRGGFGGGAHGRHGSARGFSRGEHRPAGGNGGGRGQGRPGHNGRRRDLDSLASVPASPQYGTGWRGRGVRRIDPGSRRGSF